jgi:hypothetical protein
VKRGGQALVGEEYKEEAVKECIDRIKAGNMNIQSDALIIKSAPTPVIRRFLDFDKSSDREKYILIFAATGFKLAGPISHIDGLTGEEAPRFLYVLAKLPKYTKPSEIHLPEPSLRAAFSRPYQRQELVFRFMKYIRDRLNDWKYLTFHSAYCTCFQASGTGKTRMLKVVGETHANVVYCCLRPANSSGYPGRSLIADNLLKIFGGTTSSASPVDFHDAVLQNFGRFFLASAKLVFEDETVALGTWENKWDQILNAMELIKDYSSEDCVRELDKLANMWSGRKPLLFVFDEASNLLASAVVGEKTESFANSFLRRMRGFARKFPQTNPVFLVILVDTNSSVTNFQPIGLRDPSARELRPVTLLPPFILRGTSDLFVEKMQDMDLTELSRPRYIFSFGRPLWAANLSDSFDIVGLIHFAAGKLCNNSEYSKELSDIEAIAALGPRFAIDVSPQNELSSKLVASFMRTALDISEDRSMILSMYISEPILAEASRWILNSPQRLNQAFLSLIKSMKNGAVLDGYRGELVGRIILILAHDRAEKLEVTQDAKELKAVRITTVGNFLSSLFGPAVLQKVRAEAALRDINELLEYRIFCSHFSLVGKLPDRTQLLACLQRSMGILCHRNATAIDAIIPICRGNVASKENISFIVIQIKNYSSSTDPNKALADTNLECKRTGLDSGGHPFVALHMQLGNENKPDNSSVHVFQAGERAKNIPRQITIAASGCTRATYPCIETTEIEQTLKTMLKDWHPLSSMKNTNWDLENINYHVPCFESPDK